MIAHVQCREARKAYGQNLFDLYLPSKAERATIRYGANGGCEDQDRFDKFGEPVKQAKYFNEEWNIRDRTK